MTLEQAPDSNSVSPDMRAHIGATLRDVEHEHNVTILFAVESGSRAWGFASPDSDYDVRFVYVHERNWYTGLREGRDVIERPLDERLVDLAGWDVRKALRLLLKSNPPFYEWLVSPIGYCEAGPFRGAAKKLFERHASPRVLAYAYFAIAKGQRLERGVDGGDVKLKRYFYLIRPLLSLQWVIEKRTLPPMSLQQLMQGVALSADVARAINELLERKRATPELGSGRRVALIDRWAANELERLKPEKFDLMESEETANLPEADQLFRQTAGL